MGNNVNQAAVGKMNKLLAVEIQWKIEINGKTYTNIVKRHEYKWDTKFFAVTLAETAFNLYYSLYSHWCKQTVLYHDYTLVTFKSEEYWNTTSVDATFSFDKQVTQTIFTSRTTSPFISANLHYIYVLIISCQIYLLLVLSICIYVKGENINWDVSPVFSPCHIYSTVPCVVSLVY